MATWACASCTFLNEATHLACGVCGSQRAHEIGVPPDVPPVPNVVIPTTQNTTTPTVGFAVTNPFEGQKQAEPVVNEATLLASFEAAHNFDSAFEALTAVKAAVDSGVAVGRLGLTTVAMKKKNAMADTVRALVIHAPHPTHITHQDTRRGGMCPSQPNPSTLFRHAYYHWYTREHAIL
jgi:hypothetical protein